MIAYSKRIADQYGIWYGEKDPNRQVKLANLLSTVNEQKIRDKALALIKYRYNE